MGRKDREAGSQHAHARPTEVDGGRDEGEENDEENAGYFEGAFYREAWRRELESWGPGVWYSDGH